MCKCFKCNHELIITGNSMLSDYYECDTEDDDTLISYMTCPNCGMQYEVTDTPKSEEKDFPYYSETNIERSKVYE